MVEERTLGRGRSTGFPRSLAASALALALGLVAPPPRAEACATAPPPGESVRIVDEEALIVWDAATKTQHFVRRASFRSTSARFGFLVPTPTKPELGEVDDGVFHRLRSLLVPRVERQLDGWRVEPTALFLLMFARDGQMASAPAEVAAPVRVLEERTVAGYDAVVLEADDPAALARWLEQHGFASDPTLAEWLTPYVTQRWKLTAFKIADGPTPTPGVHALASKSVRMSFITERPFFPYREPSEQRAQAPAALGSGLPPERSLRVYFVSTERAQGALGDRGAWPAETLLAEPLDRAWLECSGNCVELPLPGSPWLTVFDDRASPRPGTDEVFFAPSVDATPVEVPPVVLREARVIPIPLDLVAVGALVIGAVFVARARRS
jgi:hypothetical protein